MTLKFKKTAVISAWGWSFCVNFIVESDPSEMSPGFVVLHGVPMRTGERKRLIIDSLIRQQWPILCYRAVAQAADKIALSSWTRPKRTRYFISVTDTVFKVIKLCISEANNSFNGFNGKSGLSSTIELRIGFRSMQEAY